MSKLGLGVAEAAPEIGVVRQQGDGPGEERAGVVTGVAATAKSQVTAAFNELKQLSGGDQLKKAFQSADACKNLVPS